ncbi:Glycine receptor subunit alphaZ1 [Amphibalanus amphitrite]|uniref:Glycine receptor subunit alphaZ1 n=1 Tax=Amphibalanus amphitrite TaxID=1232801 RepID=A0A6A4W2M7_AMPAM|nr:Glycine receptor subunit alphaZ1 [Amphibalanus amphitrite]
MNIINQHEAHGSNSSKLCLCFSLTAEENLNASACVVQPQYRVIPSDYDASMPPFPWHQPLSVYISLWVASITDINEMEQEFTVDIYFRMWWSDHRIRFPVCERRSFVLLDQAQLDQLWMPDLYFTLAKTSSRHYVLLRNGGLRLSRENTQVFYSERLTVTNFCAFDFRFFPMDRQRCPMPIEPYIYHGAFVNLTFGDPGIYFNNFKFKIPQYTLSGVEPESCNYEYHFHGEPLNQTCVQGIFVLDRQFSYYFVQMYLPSILIVLVSFLSFWIPVENVPGRVALGVTSLLTLATQFTTMQRSLPPVSYMKAMDVWMFLCIVVVFLAMVEFTLAYNFRILVPEGVEPAEKGGDDRRGSSPLSPLPPVVEPGLAPVAVLGVEHNPYGKRQPKIIVVRPTNGRMAWLSNAIVLLVKKLKDKEGSLVDNVSKILFPVVFAIFNILYWTYYLNRRH